ncbi:RNA-directed DNA polymerase, eukaryota, reverse transcriptase zinc-binding domain protein [Tanacetum coccineum]
MTIVKRSDSGGGLWRIHRSDDGGVHGDDVGVKWWWVAVVHGDAVTIVSMNILSINSCGTRKRRKRMWIKDLCLKHNVHFLGIQESKMTRLELFRIKSMWGNYAFDYACSMARGLSGGLISIWGTPRLEDVTLFGSQMLDYSLDRLWSDSLPILLLWMNNSKFFTMVLHQNQKGGSDDSMGLWLKEIVIRSCLIKVNNPTLITDFRPISLIGIHYKIIAKILANRLSKVIDKIVSKEQSAFIAGRQILDGPVILSEIIEWYKKRKKKLLIFKVDFEKAFDSISWNYLIHILDSFGFGNKWCSWIKACLNSSRASILINGSPTSEFSIKRGLRQGDPLSPFLFILVMEGLHNAFEEAVGNGLITGVNIKNSTINVSHLFYADDVIITTDWNAKDMDNIIRVLHVFYLASGLKINIHKSNIYGIGVNKDEVLSMASNAGCIAGDIPFNYLGLPIGSNMKSIASWKTLVDRFHMRLSSWKANLLSIGGRLTLIKSVLGSLGIYYLSIFRAPESVLQDLERIRANFFWGGNKDKNKMAWVKWPIILNSFDKGGLNIGSLKAFNLALLQKWRWRLLSSPNALWVQVIKAYHGQEGGFDTNGCSFKGIWANIVGTSNFLHSKGIILSNTFRFKAGCGTRIRFWKDIWVGETPLFTRYNRLYHLDQDKDCLIIDRINNGQWSWNWSRTNLGVRNLAYLCDMLNEIGQLNIDVNEDTCTWSLGPNGTFTVKDARYRIDQNILPTLAHATTWDKSIPRKVNVFMWRLSLDRLPHRLNLSSRGMDIPAISCPSCNANVESANHVFFECDIATDMWKLVFRWCDIPLFQASSWDSFNDWIISWHASKEKKHRFYVITTSVLWWLWRYRNSVTFSSQPLRKSDLFDNVRFSSFSWLHNRDHMKLSWNDWLMDNVNVDLNKENTSPVLVLKSSQSLTEDDGLDLRLSLSNEDDKEDVDENENLGLRRKTGSLKVLVNKHKSVGNGQVNDLKEAKSGLLECKKVKLDRGVSEGRDASKKSVDLSGLKHSKNKVVSSTSSKKVEAKAGYGFISKADPEAMEDPFGRGGGFVPEAEPSGNMMPTLSDTNNMTLKKIRGPVIYYAT